MTAELTRSYFESEFVHRTGGSMNSDSEPGGPSPLPSPIFARCSPARGTVARKCKEFFMKRLERTATMQKRWSICDVPSGGLEGFELAPAGPRVDAESVDCAKTRVAVDDSAVGGAPKNEKIGSDTNGAIEIKLGPDCEKLDGYPLRKCRSSFDIAMDSLRREISSLIAQDNDLFRQLLSLHDSIAELRERQRHHSLMQCCDDDYEDDDDELVAPSSPPSPQHRHPKRHPSLDSLETSPESTLSSRSSLSSDSKRHSCRKLAQGQKARNYHRKSSKASSGQLTFVVDSGGKCGETCFRCRKLPLPYRRSGSVSSLHRSKQHDSRYTDSYDSGIHLHGCHSDSDHEIFV